MMTMTLGSYIERPEVTAILHYWQRRYSVNCTAYTREELLSEAYLGAWETILTYYNKSFDELLKLISLGVKWKLCNYIQKQSKWKNISVTDKIESNGYSDDIVGKIYIKGLIEDLPTKETIIVTKTLEGYTMPEIGKELNISKQRVHQILRKVGSR